MRRLAVLVTIALALLVAGCGGGTHASGPAPKAKSDGVTELKDVAQLRAAFNAREGVPRLIVLASPT
jgi:hypothetical protein